MSKFKLTIFILLIQLTATASTTQSDDVDNKKIVIDLAQIIRSIALIYTDDKLDPEVEKFLNYKPEVIWEGNAYVYLWGMDIKTDNPYETGRDILEKLVAENKLYNYEQHPLDLSFLDSYSSYDRPESDLLCKKHKPDCIEKIVNNLQETQLLLSENQFYIDRYLTFLNFKHFKQIEGRRMESPIPSYRVLVTAQKIYHIKFLQNLNETTNTEKIIQLSTELNQLEKLLGHADTLISKMVVLALINENLELFSYTYQNKITKSIELNTITVLKPLTKTEMSLYNAMYEEHSKGMKMLFDWTSDYKNLTKKAKNPFVDALMRIYHFIVAKPNLTVNTQYNGIVKDLLRITKLSPKLFYNEYLKFDNSVHHDQIRNYIGHMLTSYPMPDYLTYQARAFDIDMKLQLMRLIIHSKSTDKLKINNNNLSSYDQTPPFKKENKLCYSGLAKIFPEFRCLNIY